MANFIQAFVNRPIMAIAVNVVLLVVGLVAFNKLELRHQPNVEVNEVRINTKYTGGSSSVVEQRITKPLEDALSGLDGIKSMTSVSEDGKSEIHVKFRSGVDTHKALSQVRDRVFSSVHLLPNSADRPIVDEGYENARTLLYVSFKDDSRSMASLTDYVRRNVEERLRLLEGVAGFFRFGDKIYTVSVQLDPAQLAEQQVTVTDVMNALKQEKAFASGGEIETATGKRTVVVSSLLNSPTDFENITVAVKLDKAGKLDKRISLGEVATVRIIEKPTDYKVRLDGQEVVVIGINAKPQANPLEVAERVRSFLNDLKKSMPDSIKASVIYDVTEPFERSVTEIQYTIWEAIALVGLIVTISLISIRAAVLPIITIPLCLIGSFALMWLFGFSINPITLLALVLAVGLVVDDAIVVVENIHQHMESGLSALQAARKGMKEISFAIIVMTITLAAVYLPVAFQADESAVMFKEFAWTLAGTVIISGFVALTLTPALSGKFLKPDHASLYWQPVNRYYYKFLNLALENPWKIVGLGLVVGALGVWGFLSLPQDLKPTEDEGYLNGFILATNEVPNNLKEDWFKKTENVIAQQVPERDHFFTFQVQDNLWFLITLKSIDERKASAETIAKRLKEPLGKIAGPMVGVNFGNSGGLGDEPLKLIIQYSGETQGLLKTVKHMMDEIRAAGFEQVESEQGTEKTRLHVFIDRSLANELGVRLEDIETTLYTFLSGVKATDFTFKGFDYDVLVRADEQSRTELDHLNRYFVVGGEKQWIPLGSLVSLKEIKEPNQIKHFDRTRGAAIKVGIKPGVSLGETMERLEPIIKKNIPQDARYRFGGKAEKYKEAQQAMWLTYGLSLIFIYLVLAALFESFVHPLIVLLTVPLSVTGAVWAIHAIGGTNNIYTAIGLVTLIGLITKHGILIVDFSNRLREAGKPMKEAVLQAASSRLRPVLMTTFAMVFGAVPLVFSTGAGAIAREHIGWVIIGGMLTGTVLSLFVIPVVYSFLAKR